MKGYLVLENGEVFEGQRIGFTKDAICEVVFNTSMTGYLGIITDPAYLGISRSGNDLSVNWKLWINFRR